MFVIGGALIGVLAGVRLAMKHGGRKLDALQYAAGLGILGALIGVFATIITHRAYIGG